MGSCAISLIVIDTERQGGRRARIAADRGVMRSVNSATGWYCPYSLLVISEIA